MNLLQTEVKEKRKCFEYGKTGYIRRFCKSKDKTLTVVDSGNEETLTQKGSQEKIL